MNFNPLKKTNRTAEDAAADWMDAKNAEIKANRERIAAEDELVELLGAREEGGDTHQIGPYKVAITGRLNRKVDFDVLDKLNIPANLKPVKYKPELDLKGLRYLESNEPEVYVKFSKALTIEPAKTSVTVTRTEK